MNSACRELAVTVRWADYALVELEEADGGDTSVWRRTPHEAALPIATDGGTEPIVRDVPGSHGLQLHFVERPIDPAGLSDTDLPASTRSVSCFLVNRRKPDDAQPSVMEPGRELGKWMMLKTKQADIVERPPRPVRCRLPWERANGTRRHGGTRDVPTERASRFRSEPQTPTDGSRGSAIVERTGVAAPLPIRVLSAAHIGLPADPYDAHGQTEVKLI